MKKFFHYAACLFMGLSLTACSDDDPTDPGIPDQAQPKRIEFSYTSFAKELNKDYSMLCDAYKEYVVPTETKAETEESFVIGAYVNVAPDDSMLLHITFRPDHFGKVSDITAKIDRETNVNVMKLWSYFMNNAEELQLGQFLGTKFSSPAGGGIYQTLEESIKQINNSTYKNMETYTMFGVAPATYAVVANKLGHFEAHVTNSFYKFDIGLLRSLIGQNHDAFYQQNKIIGNKINFFGNLYVYFYRALDLEENIFQMEVHADKDLTNISEVDVYICSEEEVYSPAQQLDIWKKYLSNHASLHLGKFVRAFRTDSEGSRVKNFASTEDIIAYIDANGRPEKEQGGIISIFESDGLRTSMVLNADFAYLIINTPDEEEVVSDRANFDLAAFAQKINTDFGAFKREHQLYLPEFIEDTENKDQFVFNGYMKVENDSLLLKITAQAENKVVASISAELEDAANTLGIWEKCLSQNEALKFGKYQGTKYRGKSGSGLHQKIEDAINHIKTNGATDNESYSIFNTIPNSVHSVVALVNGSLNIELIKSYIDLDIANINKLIGSDFDAYADKYYLIGNKINMFGSSYFSFSTAKDKQGYFYSGKITPDSGKKIKTIELSVHTTLHDAQKQMDIWEAYVTTPDMVGIGNYIEAYTCDNWGSKKTTFNTQGELLKYIEENGRPKSDFDDGVTVIFEKLNIRATLLLNSKEIKLTIVEKA